MLMQVPADAEGNRLALVTFDADNEQTKRMIPSSGGITAGYYPSTAIMPDNTVVWADVSDKENYRLFKWSPTTNSTSLVTSIPLFDLAQYSNDYQAGIAEPLSFQQNKTGYVYADSLIVMNTTTVAFLDAMVTRGDGKQFTEAAVRVNGVEIVSGIVQRERLALYDDQVDYWKDKGSNLQWFYFGASIDLSLGKEKFNGILSLVGDQQNGRIQVRQSMKEIVGFSGVSFKNSIAVGFTGTLFKEDAQSDTGYVNSGDSILVCTLRSTICQLTEANINANTIS